MKVVLSLLCVIAVIAAILVLCVWLMLYSASADYYPDIKDLWHAQKVRKEIQEIEMSKQHPECPLFNQRNCKELDNRKICAIVRKDKKCLRKLPKSVKKAKK